MNSLRTRHVFLDTSVFVAANFASTSKPFASLKDLVDEGKVLLHLPDVTIHEIAANLREAVRNARQATERWQRDARVLRNLGESPFLALFKHVSSEDELVAALCKQLAESLAALHVDVIATDSVLPSEVFAKYFAGTPPFGSGKKKSEFPDAFAIGALLKWCIKHDDVIYVVGYDPDMEHACQEDARLIFVKGLAQLLDLVASDEALAAFIHKLTAEHQDEIVDRICEDFPALGFWLTNQEGDVLEVAVPAVALQEPSIIEMDEDSAVLEIIAEVTFSAEVKYDDPDTAVYEGGEKVLTLFTIEKTVEETVEIPIELTISFSQGESNKFDIQRLILNRGEDIGVEVDDGYPWK